MPDTIESLNGQRVRFGAGLRHEIGVEMARAGLRAALVLSTPEQGELARSVAASLGPRAAGVLAEAAMHTPTEVTARALAVAARRGADCVVSVGGGSTIGLGKAIALHTDLVQIVVPTTYAGSEATPILGQTEAGVKTTQSSPKVLPEVILYDPELVTSLPGRMTVTSALNAIAHAAEALYARDRSAATGDLALDGIRSMAEGLPLVVAAPGDVAARETTLRGAWACGTVLGEVGMALHHKLCHTLGGTLGLPHAETHAIVLPHALAYNEAAVPELLAPMAALLGGPTASRAVWQFARATGAPVALSELGVGPEDVDRVVELALRNPYWNPREVTEAGLRGLLLNAIRGLEPQ